MTRLRKVSCAAFLVILCVAGVSAVALAQFETRTSVPAAPSSESIAVGDFNRDGKLDVAVADNSLQVFLGNGDGTFQPAANYLSGTGAIFVATADFNQDGKLDLAVADLNGLFVLIGNGDGTFQTPVAYTTACIPIFVSTGDFNGDHKVDLLVTYSSGSCGYVSIFLGNGDGTFQQTPINTSTLYNPAATGIGDFNGDGKLDLAVAEQFGMISQVEILLGNGNGTFSSSATYKVGASPTSVAVADFRGNGKLDLAVATLPGWTYVLLGNGDGTFASEGRSATADADWVVAADFNGDGKPDLAVASQVFPPQVNVLLGNGDGTFQAPMYYPVGTDDRFVGVGDFNGDHKTDLIVPDYRYGNVMLLLNTGVVSFSPTKPVTYPFQLVGTASATQTVTLTNTGTTALAISSIQTSSPFRQNNTCGKSVAPGAKCDIEITFKPKAPGKAAGTVSISDSASSKPQVIELTGAGTLANISPLKLSFAPQSVGTKSAPQNITLTNASTTAMSVTQIFVDGNAYRDFPETNNCPASLNAGASCTIAVTFDPARKGSRTASVFIDDNGGGSPQVIPLTGTGD
jgi:FG-GAP-like repeat/Protein of unknown function (DUF1573)